ncbi:MAG: GatB/YqeY domain-containing protein [Saprospiraceae bacterium]|nr:GatB/YqeY domain-containing protein [Saprospiraceae bacterium]
MTLEEKINQDLKTAMKAQDKGTLRAVRAIKSAILLQKTDGSGEELTADREIQMLQKLIKTRTDSLEIYRQQGRSDLAFVEEEEIEVIRKYLPAQLDDAALEEVVQGIINETGASSMKDMGRVVGLANQRLAGQAEGLQTEAFELKSL